MAAKLCVLAAVTLLLSASASADSNSASQVLVKELWKLAPGTAEGDAIDVKSLEDTVTNMMLNKGEAGFGATPFGNSVKKIINLIDKEMFPKVKEGHKADQEELNALAKTWTKCGSLSHHDRNCGQEQDEVLKVQPIAQDLPYWRSRFVYFQRGML
jgi:hypothetical protein